MFEKILAGAQMRQKWKTAFGRPPGKLVNSLKVGAGVDRSKYSFARYYEGHQDGVWHVAATSNFVTALVGSASAGKGLNSVVIYPFPSQKSRLAIIVP